MEIINQMAALVGISPGMFIFLTVAAVVLLGGLAVLKALVKMAWKTFTTIFILVVLLLGGLYVGSLMLNVLPQ